jgi:hypothetical protein
MYVFVRGRERGRCFINCCRLSPLLKSLSSLIIIFLFCAVPHDNPGTRVSPMRLKTQRVSLSVCCTGCGGSSRPGACTNTPSRGKSRSIESDIPMRTVTFSHHHPSSYLLAKLFISHARCMTCTGLTFLSRILHLMSCFRRYGPQEASLKDWDDSKPYTENNKAFNWVPGVAYRPEREEQIRAALAGECLFVCLYLYLFVLVVCVCVCIHSCEVSKFSHVF